MATINRWQGRSAKEALDAFAAKIDKRGTYEC